MRPVEAGRQHSSRMVPRKRSQTALWLGERGGVLVTQAFGRQVGPEGRGEVLRPFVAEHGPHREPVTPKWCSGWSTKRTVRARVTDGHEGHEGHEGLGA